MNLTDKEDFAQTFSRVPLAMQVHEVLSEMLLSGALAPDERVSMRDLADRLGLSVMPVREAVNRLVARGALHVMPNRAVRVPLLTTAEFRDLVEVRLQVEGWAVRKAAQRVGPASEPRLRLLETAFREAMSDTTGRSAVKANKALHFYIYEQAGSPIMMEVISVLWLKAGPIINLDLGQQVRRSRNAASLENHAALVAALLSGDAAAAEAALTSDITSAADFILSRGILKDETKGE